MFIFFEKESKNSVMERRAHVLNASSIYAFGTRIFSLQRSTRTTTTTRPTMASTSTALRPSLDNAESNVHIDRANAIVGHFNSIQPNLHLLASKSRFEDRIRDFANISDGESSNFPGGQKVPDDILFELESQMVSRQYSSERDAPGFR